mmetsp:Transcript_5832/g.6337  ORF Transcript_5832/g.6337 Transcript_5832/m.6337 type:complete len:111 (-) Transcript_5832:191-523(-)
MAGFHNKEWSTVQGLYERQSGDLIPFKHPRGAKKMVWRAWNYFTPVFWVFLIYYGYNKVQYFRYWYKTTYPPELTSEELLDAELRRLRESTRPLSGLERTLSQENHEAYY